MKDGDVHVLFCRCAVYTRVLYGLVDVLKYTLHASTSGALPECLASVM